MNLKLYTEQAIQTVDQQRGYRSEVSIEINREELDRPKVIFDRAREKGLLSLTGPEMDLLWMSDEVDAAALADFFNNLFPNEEDISPSDILKEREGWRRYQEEMDRRR